MLKILFLTFLNAMGCTQEYAVINSKEPEKIYITETETETITVTEEVEVPVYVEVEVPAENGDVWVDSFTQVGTIDGIDILWVIDKSGSMNRFDDALLAGW